MNGITRSAPAREFNLLRREMDRLFNDFTPNTEGRDTSVWMPRADLAENDDAFLLSLDLPGIPADEVEVTMEDDTLTISGERTVERNGENGRFHRIERRYGRFLRTVQFGTPIDAERVEASFEDGVLTINVPKAEASKPRRINVRGTKAVGGDVRGGDGHSVDATDVEVTTAEENA